MLTLLINLDGSDARLQRASDELKAQGLDFIRVPAFDGRKLVVDDFSRYNSSRARRYMGRDCIGGEIGCYMSHVECARRFLDSDERYALILEDDIYLFEDFALHLHQLIAWFDAHPNYPWHLLNLGDEKLKRFMSTPVQSFGEHTLYRTHYFPMRTCALLWSRAGAKAFLENSKEIFCPIDNFLRYLMNRSGMGLGFSPPMVGPTAASSDIDIPTAVSRHKGSGRGMLNNLWRKQRLLTEKYFALKGKLLQTHRLKDTSASSD